MSRRLVLAAAWAAMTLGLITILSLSMDTLLRAAAMSLWGLVGSAELHFIASAQKRFLRIRIFSDGRCELLDHGGQWHSGKLKDACVVLPRQAWLQVQPDSGRCYRELVRGDARENKQWRRLQVIWRHLGAAR